MNKQIWQIAFVFAFSSLGPLYLGGWEVFRSFSRYGSWGLFGLLLAAGSLSWSAYQLSRSSHQHDARNIRQLLAVLLGPAAAPFFSFVLHLLVLVFAAKITADLAQKLQTAGFLPFAVGVLLILALLWQLTGRIDWRRLMLLSGWAILLGLAVHAFFYLDMRPVRLPSLLYQLNANWLWASLQYIGLHLLLLTPVAVMLAKQTAGDARLLKHGIIRGGGIFTLLLLLAHLAIQSHWHDVHDAELPLYQVLREAFAPALPFYLALDWLYGFLSILLWLFCLVGLLSGQAALNQGTLLLSFCFAVLAFAFASGPPKPAVSVVHLAAACCGLTLLFALLWQRQRP